MMGIRLVHEADVKAVALDGFFRRILGTSTPAR